MLAGPRHACPAADLLAGCIRKTANIDRLLGALHVRPEARLAPRRLALGTREDALEGRQDLVRQHHVVGLDDLEIGQHGVPGYRPGRDRPRDRAIVREDLDVVAQADVARLGLRGRLDAGRKEYEAGERQPLQGGKTHAAIVAWAGLRSKNAVRGDA